MSDLANSDDLVKMTNRPKTSGRKYSGYEMSEYIWDLKTARFKKNPDYKKPSQYPRFIIPALAAIALALAVRIVFFELR